MRIIGLTGPTGAGKSTLCEKFESLGIPCINTDDIYHSITSYASPCVKELQATFGDEIIDEKSCNLIDAIQYGLQNDEFKIYLQFIVDNRTKKLIFKVKTLMKIFLLSTPSLINMSGMKPTAYLHSIKTGARGLQLLMPPHYFHPRHLLRLAI